MLLNAATKAINDRKDEIAYAHFGITYRQIIQNPYDGRAKEMMDLLSRAYSITILEWTDVEKEMVNYLRDNPGQ